MGHPGFSKEKTALNPRANRAAILRFVRKRDGRIMAFNREVISRAIYRAISATGLSDELLAGELALMVEQRLLLKPPKNFTFEVEQIQDTVEKVLIDAGESKIAKVYILYRQRRAEIRQEKQQILNKKEIDEVDKSFDINALRLLAANYLRKDEEERPVETPKQLFLRVAVHALLPSLFSDPLVLKKKSGVPQPVAAGPTIEEFNPVKSEGVFRIGRYPLNRWHLTALKRLFLRYEKEGRLAVTWPGFLKLLRDGRFNHHEEKASNYYELLVKRQFLPHPQMLANFGNVLGAGQGQFVLRPEDSVASIMETLKAAAIIFFQAGGEVTYDFSRLRPAGDFVRSNHGMSAGPLHFMKFFDHLEGGNNIFVLNSDHPDIEQFIDSGRGGYIRLRPDFWEYYERGEPYPLTNPRNQKVVRRIAPERLLVNDLGLIFDRDWPAVYAAGAINIWAFVKDGKIDWPALEKTTRLAAGFLDNSLEVNRYPLPEIETEALKERKIGLGIMGTADLFYELNLPYDSRSGRRLLEKILSFLNRHSKAVSRSAITTAIGGTETLAILAGCTSGIEPAAGLVLSRHIGAYSFYYIDPVFEIRMRRADLLDEALVRNVANAYGSISKVSYVSEELRKIFVTAADIAPENYLKMVAAAQRWTDSPIAGVTISLPEEASDEKVKKIKILAYRAGCQAVLVRRQTSRPAQQSLRGLPPLMTLTDAKAKGPGVYLETGIVRAWPGPGVNLCPHCRATLLIKANRRSCSNCEWEVYV